MSPEKPPEPPLHLRPATAVASDALLPGDPGRALALAQSLLVKARMTNHARGLWGYSGKTEAGDPLTIQATGIGGPSAAIVISELAALGTRRAIRVGTCGALDPDLELGQLLAVSAAIAADGTSAGLGAGRVVDPDPALTAALEAQGASAHKVASTDLFYEVEPERPREWAAEGASAVEMEAAALFALGPQIGVSVACLLVVSDTFDSGGPGAGKRHRIDDESLGDAAERMGRVAAAGLAATR